MKNGGHEVGFSGDFYGRENIGGDGDERTCLRTSGERNRGSQEMRRNRKAAMDAGKVALRPERSPVSLAFFTSDNVYYVNSCFKGTILRSFSPFLATNAHNDLVDRCSHASECARFLQIPMAFPTQTIASCLSQSPTTTLWIAVLMPLSVRFFLICACAS